MNTLKKIWIVGGSLGIGLELVKQSLEKKYLVIASSRNTINSKELNKLKKEYPNSLALVNIDLNKKETIIDSINEAWRSFGGIDIWFYNAASYEVMSLDQWDYEKFENMTNVNYLGAVKIMNLLVPILKKEKLKCHWVWNCSLSSYFGLAKGGGYSAPKAALVNLAESIHPELKNINIDLQIINHGFVKTRLTQKNDFEMPQLMSPEYTARKILLGMNNKNRFEIRFPFFLSFILRIIKFLPYKLSLAINRKLL